ncbi:MAG TPA: NUDIX domain-containing protein [Actinomycetaceae bacterium]|nr:NUDIX domain-containing protein [Actinomycetaceae bacterium]
MSTPDFILALREKVGTAPLWLSGVTAVVERDGEILMVRRADNGRWTPVTGIIDPGEEPAAAARREILEETGVHAEAVRLASVTVTKPVTYANGDVTQYIDLCFRFRWISGEPYPADGENTEAHWIPFGELPELSPQHAANVARALSDAEAAYFRS